MSSRNAYFHGKRVSVSHLALLEEAERRGILTHINQGRRTLAEQAVFYATYLRYGKPKAAKPLPSAPHIKSGHEHHALDIDDGIVDHVATFYAEMGVATAFNVPSEGWHMDTLDEGKLVDAAGSLRAKGGILATVSFGISHADVLVLRRRLRRAGYYAGTVTGRRFGPFLRGRVRAFQRDHRLKADGACGQGTWPKVMAAPRDPSPTVTSQAGIAAIKQREGVRLKAYKVLGQDGKPLPTEKYWTIGVGHYGPDVREGQTITEQEAERLLRLDLAAVEIVIRTVQVPLRPREFDALASLGFNIGTGGLKSSTVLKRLNRGERHKAADAFLMWNKPAVLVPRRRDERAQFLGG